MGLVNKIKNISGKTWVKIIFISIFLMMLVLNILTPLIADDYSYSFIFSTDHRIKNLLDVINSQAIHYMTWGGRSVAHFIAQVFLMFPKIIFSVLNSVVYTGIIYLIYRVIKGNKDDKPLLVLGIHLMIYFLTPVFGQNCLWLIGSCNYVWTTCLILLLIFNFIIKGDKKDSILRIICMLILGILAGWTNENTSFGLIVILIGTLIINKINKEKISKWKISGLVGAILGFITMIGAPGNYARSSEFVDHDFIIIKWLKRFIECTRGLGQYCWIFIVALIILFTIYIYNRKKINKFVYVFILGAIFTVYSMILSPTFPERSWFGTIIFFTIAIMLLVYDLDSIKKVFKPIIIDIIIVLSILYGISYVCLAKDINRLRTTWNYRISEIKKIKGKEDSSIEFEAFYTENWKNPNFGLVDLTEETKEWPDRDISEYYGIDSISSKLAE